MPLTRRRSAIARRRSSGSRPGRSSHSGSSVVRDRRGSLHSIACASPTIGATPPAEAARCPSRRIDRRAERAPAVPRSRRRAPARARAPGARGGWRRPRRRATTGDATRPSSAPRSNGMKKTSSGASTIPSSTRAVAELDQERSRFREHPAVGLAKAAAPPRAGRQLWRSPRARRARARHLLGRDRGSRPTTAASGSSGPSARRSASRP